MGWTAAWVVLKDSRRMGAALRLCRLRRLIAAVMPWDAADAANRHQYVKIHNIETAALDYVVHTVWIDAR